MDLWDVVKLIARYWYMTAPIVLLGLVVTFTVIDTGTEYRVNGVMLLTTSDISGAGQDAERGSTVVRAADAAIVSEVVLNSDLQRTQLAEAGYATDYNVNALRDEAFVLIGTAAETPGLAIATTQTVARLYAEELLKQQLRFGGSTSTVLMAELVELGDPEVGHGGRRRVQGVMLFATAVAVLVAVFVAEAAAQRARTRRDRHDISSDEQLDDSSTESSDPLGDDLDSQPADVNERPSPDPALSP